MPNDSLDEIYKKNFPENHHAALRAVFEYGKLVGKAEFSVVFGELQEKYEHLKAEKQTQRGEPISQDQFNEQVMGMGKTLSPRHGDRNV